MHKVMIFILVLQVLTFLVLGVFYLQIGVWRLGVAQLLLAAVQGIIYSGGFE